MHEVAIAFPQKYFQNFSIMLFMQRVAEVGINGVEHWGSITRQ
jgi:hypothetical protein